MPYDRADQVRKAASLSVSFMEQPLGAGRRAVVVGAGVAGLAAAGRLRRAGWGVELIEAAPHPGGRARTTAEWGAPFDHGASWLHDAARNPLAALAGAEDGLIDSDAGRAERVSIGGRPATAAELAGYDAAFAAADALAREALARPDTTLAAALAPRAADPWTALLLLWEGAIIAAADADRLGLHDWARNRLEGHNAVPPEGVGAYVLRKLATAATLGCPATAIRWGGPGVRVDTPRGRIRADAAVITVSTGVLAAEAIRFDPPLPPAVRDAVAALPMGLLSKVLLPAGGPDRLGLAADTLVTDRRGQMTFNAWPQDRPHLVGFTGGRTAWNLVNRPDAAIDLARQELALALGSAALDGIGPGGLATDWGENPLFRGAYAYAGPGKARERAVLAAAFPGERLVFAGEATRTDGLAGTVGGAFLSGVEAAERLIAAPAAGPAGSP